MRWKATPRVSARPSRRSASPWRKTRSRSGGHTPPRSRNDANSPKPPRRTPRTPLDHSQIEPEPTRRRNKKRPARRRWRRPRRRARCVTRTHPRLKKKGRFHPRSRRRHILTPITRTTSLSRRTRPARAESRFNERESQTGNSQPRSPRLVACHGPRRRRRGVVPRRSRGPRRCARASMTGWASGRKSQSRRIPLL